MDNEYFWSLVLEPNWVQAAIWEIDGKTARILSVSQGASWQGGDDLLKAVDSALSLAITDGDFPESFEEPSKTVFGVPGSWVAEGQIKKEYLDKIRNLCSKLSLSPGGFVVLSEAIAHYLKVKEGTPLTAVIVGFEASQIEVTVFRLGNLLGTVRVGRSVSVANDLIEALLRFSGNENLPSRFILYDGKDSELLGVKEELLNASWDSDTEKIKFLHPPKIEIIDPKTRTIAVSLAGASEIGDVEDLALDGEVEKKDSLEAVVPEKNEGEIDDTTKHSLEDAGFVIEKDIRDLGPNEVEPEFEKPLKSRNQKIMRGKNIFRAFKLRINLIRMPSFQGKKLLFVFGAFLILLIVGLGLFWWLVPKAKIFVYVSPRNLEGKETVTFVKGAGSLQVDKRILPAELFEENVEGEKTRSSSGARTVGEKARGKVMIRNGTSTEIILDLGTVLIGPNDLKFGTDEEAAVPAADSPSSPGTTVIGVTAEDIGAQYNLAEKEEFKVANFPKSEVDAVTQEDLTGGSSREVIVVSEDDIKDLEEDLLDELKEKGKLEIEKRVGKEKSFIADTVTIEVASKNFSSKAGDQAETLRLTMGVKVSGLTVNLKDLGELAFAILKDRVPQGFVLKTEQIDLTYSLSGKEGDSFFVDTMFSANLLPDVNPDVIIATIAGKNPEGSYSYLESIPGYSSAEIRVRPRLPGFLGNIPRNQKNIDLEIVSEK